jgi:hypothetical protein
MTAIHNGTAGEVYYAKPSPASDAAWDSDDIALVVNPNLSSQFTFENDPTIAYDIYRRAGVSPANTDEIVATVGVSPQAAAAAAIEEAALATAGDVVDEIENRGITTVAVQSGVTNSTTLELVQGDTYDGIGKPLLGFTVTKDYTDGWTATITIRDEDDAVVASHTGTVASATSITFSITAPTGLTMSGCPGSWKGKFDVQLSKSTSRDTIARGACYVYEDQTRT